MMKSLLFLQTKFISKTQHNEIIERIDFKWHAWKKSGIYEFLKMRYNLQRKRETNEFANKRQTSQTQSNSEITCSFVFALGFLLFLSFKNESSFFIEFLFSIFRLKNVATSFRVGSNRSK